MRAAANAWARVDTRLGTVDLARRAARRRLPRAVFDYIDGGAESEATMRANRVAFESLGLEPRMGVTAGKMELATTVLGQPLSLPLILAPVGYTRMMRREGDVAGAAAAGKAGTIFTLSSMSGHTMEEVAAAASGPLWFQLYFLGGRAGAEQLVDRAQRAGYHALVVTLDTQIPSKRERDTKNGLQPPIKLTPGNALHFGPRFLPYPKWLYGMAQDRFKMEIANANGLAGRDGPMPLDEAVAGFATEPPRWEDFAWMRERWRGPIIAKGIVSADDARRAVDAGVDAIVVSNHGGRQLDGMRASLPALVEVVDAVGDQVEILVDSGVRRGSDIARALALGAKAVLVGRAWAYALAAGGQAGIEAILAMFASDLDRTLRLLGCPSVHALDRGYVQLPAGWADPGRGGPQPVRPR